MSLNPIYMISRGILIVAGCFIFILSGCENQPESSNENKVISKEILISKKEVAVKDSAGKEPADIAGAIKTTEGQSSPETGEKKETSVQDPMPVAGEADKSTIEQMQEQMQGSAEKPSSDPAAAVDPVQTPQPSAAEGTSSAGVPPQMDAPNTEMGAPPAMRIEGEALNEPKFNAGGAAVGAESVPGPEPASMVGPEQNLPQSSVLIDMDSVKLSYIYNPVGKIDPFASIFKEQPEPERMEPDRSAKEKRIPMTPLEKISLDQLKLVAVMLAPSGDKALVEEASGKGYVITQGTFIGKDSGTIADILMDRIIIEEEVQDLLGKMVLRKTEMMLQKTPGE